ncbi:MAG: acyltransferase [Pseudomonadota bacterium]
MTTLHSADDLRQTRHRSLDGLRGLGALCVLVHHFIAAFLPAAYFGAKGVNTDAFQDWLASSPWVVFYNGSFAVHAFFALSGFVIAQSMSPNTVPLTLLVGRRYLRLGVPMLVSAGLAYVLLKVFGDSSRAAAQVVGNAWLQWYHNPSPTFFQAAWDAVFNPFRFGESNINRVLWTMRVELFGSIAIYLVYRLVPRQAVVPCLFALLLLTIPARFGLGAYMGMAGGALLFEAHARGRLEKLRAGFLGPFLIVAGLLLGGRAARDPAETHFYVLHQALSVVASSFEFTLALGAILLLAGVLLTAGAHRFLERRVPQFLGRISFALYLVHIPLMTTLVTSVYLLLPATPARWLLALPVYLVAAFGAAWLMTRFVDEPLTRQLRRVKAFPAQTWLRVLHAVLAALLVGFVGWRLRGDVLSIFVALCGYAGVFLVGQLLLVRVRAAGLSAPRSAREHRLP